MQSGWKRDARKIMREGCGIPEETDAERLLADRDRIRMVRMLEGEMEFA